VGCSYWGAWIDESTKQSGIRIASDFDWIEFVMSNKSRDPALANKLFDIQIDDLRVADFMWQIKDYRSGWRNDQRRNEPSWSCFWVASKENKERYLTRWLVPTLLTCTTYRWCSTSNRRTTATVIESVAILAACRTS